MKSKNILVFLFLFIVLQSRAQAVYVEVFGKGWVNSINYEHSLNNTVQGFNVQLGIGFLPTSLITIPASINYVFGRKKHHFELGGGVTYVNGMLWLDDDDFGPAFWIHSNLLYRYEKPQGKFFFKIGATPVIGRNFRIGPWFGIGLGYKFKPKKQS